MRYFAAINSPMIRFGFQLTREEYFRFNYYTAWASPQRRPYRLRYFARVIFFYSAVALLYLISRQSPLFWIDITVFVVVGLIYLLLTPILIRWSVRRKVADILSRKENQHVLENAEIILSESGIIDRDAVSESKYSWDAIVRYAETEDSHYLYTNSYYAIVIPKRVIPTETDRREMEQLLAVHLPLQA